jgi:hypothetical protein
VRLFQLSDAIIRSMVDNQFGQGKS